MEGSIVGSLEATIVHKGNEFRVWDENTGKAVPCYFPDHLLPVAAGHLKRRVLVYGTARLNRLDNIVSLQAKGIDDFRESNLPTIKEMSGLVDDLTGGLPLSEYMKQLCEEDD